MKSIALQVFCSQREKKQALLCIFQSVGFEGIYNGVVDGM